MADLAPRFLQKIRSQNQDLGDCLKDIVDAHNNIAQQGNTSPVGLTPAPTPHAALNVTGGNGYFAVQIVDNSPTFRGKEHFVAVSESQDMSNAHKIHLGASKTWYGFLGAKKLHFASYPSYPTTGPATPIYAFNVDGTGMTAPALPGDGEALAGFGTQPYNRPTVPIR